MTHYDVIIFEKLKLKINPKTNNCKNNFEIPLNPAKDMNITRFTCLRFARQVSPPYLWFRRQSMVHIFAGFRPLKTVNLYRIGTKQDVLTRSKWCSYKRFHTCLQAVTLAYKIEKLHFYKIENLTKWKTWSNVISREILFDIYNNEMSCKQNYVSSEFFYSVYYFCMINIW